MSWIARLSRNMQEVRIVLCAESQHSAGARAFIDKNYVQIKRLNPKLPFRIRHGENQSPRIIARFDYGGEAVRDLTNMTEEQVREQLRDLNALGEVALKANVMPWQESVPQDFDTVVYDPHDPRQHMI